MQLPHWTRGLHHDGSEAYLSNPLPQAGETVTVRLRVPKEAPVRGVYLRTCPDGENHITEMRASGDTPTHTLYSAPMAITMPRNEYRFKLITDEGAYYYNALGVSRADSPDYFDFVLLANYQAPRWVYDAVFYQIFPDRFYNGDPSNDVQEGEWIREGVPTHKRNWGEIPTPWHKSRSVDFFGGDLPGITQKLEYVADLGATALYLTPIFKASSNHRYDIADYTIVDPHLGSDEALAGLRAALDAYGMQLMLDITPNHIGDLHHWFKKAQANPSALEREYFFFDDQTGACETWLGVPTLIKLNYTSPRLREVMYRAPDSALRRWLRPPYRIDSWRLDVSNMTGNLRMTQLDHEVHREMRQALKADSADLYILGEHFHDGTPHTQGEELDATMNYQGFNIPVRRWLGGEDMGVADGHAHGDTSLMPTAAMAEQWQRFMAAVPYSIALQQFNQLGSHDTTRILRVTKGNRSLVRLGMALLMAFPGVPCIYYGDEISMDGGKDPDNRRCMPWDESEWDQDMRTYVQKLISIRRSAPALKQGGFQLLHAEGDLVALLRRSLEQTIIFAGYRGAALLAEAELPLRMGGIADGSTLRDLISGATFTVRDGILRLKNLAQGSAFLLEVQG